MLVLYLCIITYTKSMQYLNKVKYKNIVDNFINLWYNNNVKYIRL